EEPLPRERGAGDGEPAQARLRLRALHHRRRARGRDDLVRRVALLAREPGAEPACLNAPVAARAEDRRAPVRGVRCGSGKEIRSWGPERRRLDRSRFGARFSGSRFATGRRGLSRLGGSMNRTRRVSRRFVSLVLAAALAPLSGAQTMQDPDFVVEDLAGTYVQPTCFRFVSATEFLVCEKAGIVWDVRNGVKQPTPVIDLHLEILNNGDR